MAMVHKVANFGRVHPRMMPEDDLSLRFGPDVPVCKYDGRLPFQLNSEIMQCC